MTGEGNLPMQEAGKDKRSRLRAEHKAESTWRRHEIYGRIKALQTGQDKLEKQIGRVLEFLETIGMPKVRNLKSVEGKELPMGELPEKPKEEEEDDPRGGD